MNLVSLFATPMGAFLLVALTAILCMLIANTIGKRGTFVGRMRTTDNYSAFVYRQGAGFPGDVSRGQNARVEPCLIDANAPPTAYGQPVLVDSTTQGVRPFTTGDQSNTVAAGYGLTVRPFPLQARAGGDSASFGAATPPTSGEIDVLRGGYIMVQLNDITATPKKGDPVYVWAVATSGAHTQGGIEAVYSAGNTTQLSNATFNGGPDANGVCEIVFNV